MADRGSELVEPTEVAVDACVARLRNAYLELLRRLFPKASKVGGDPSAWAALAAFLERRSLDAHEYVRYVYDHVTPVVGDFRAATVTRLDNVRAFVKDKPDLDEQLALIVELQFFEVEQRLLKGEGLRDIVRNPKVSLSAVFRYALCVKFGFEEDARRLYLDAHNMLLFKPAYRRLLSGLLEGSPEHGGHTCQQA